MALVAALGLAGCKGRGGESCNPDDHQFEQITVAIQAAADLNLDRDDRPLPTVVHVVQLSGDLATRSLDFAEIIEDPKVALGDEWISSMEFEIYPDSVEHIPISPAADARYLLAFAVFQQPVGNTWFRVYPLPRHYGEQACAASDRDEDPASLGQPCMYLWMERNQVDGGDRVPPGFDASALETVCAPLFSPATVTAE